MREVACRTRDEGCESFGCSGEAASPVGRLRSADAIGGAISRAAAGAAAAASAEVACAEEAKKSWCAGVAAWKCSGEFDLAAWKSLGELDVAEFRGSGELDLSRAR